MKEKYLIMCNRHNSYLGDHFCLWWGHKEKKGGYSSDFRHAHLFNYKEIEDKKLFGDKEDIPIKLSDLGYTEESFHNLPQDENLRMLIEKGTLNKKLGLNIKKR